MDRPKLVRNMAAATRGVGVTGTAAALIIALFAGLASKGGIAIMVVAIGGGWWAIWEGLAAVFQRNADRLHEEAERVGFTQARSRL